MPNKAKILVVDDEASVCEALTYALEQEGYEAASSTNVQEAVERLVRERFQLVLSDVRIPGVKGLEALGRFRQVAPDVPVMLISGHGTPREAAEAMRQGAVDYLEKPFEAHDLLSSVQRTLKGSGPGWKDRIRLLKALDDLAAARRKILQNEALSLTGFFTAGIAHELSNPLSAVMGYVSMLLGDKGIKPEHREDLRAIERQAIYCRELVLALLEQVRGEIPSRSSVAVDAVLEEAMKLARPVFFTKKVRLRWKPDAEGLRVRASKIEIQQVVLNLISNAIAAVEGRPEAEVTLKTHRREHSVEITVSDNGPGVPLEHRKRIFEPFFTTKSKGRGTGLGLSLSHNIIEHLGGSVSVRGGNGCGAVFSVQLPEEKI